MSNDQTRNMTDQGPYARQYDISVATYRRNSNGFHPKSAQERIDAALAGLGPQFAEADTLYLCAEKQQAEPGGVDVRALSAALESLDVALKGFDETLATVLPADDSKIRSLSVLDQAAARNMAKRQQDTDRELSGALAALLAIVAADFNAFIAATRDPAAQIEISIERGAAANADFPQAVREASAKAAAEGLQAVTPSSPLPD